MNNTNTDIKDAQVMQEKDLANIVARREVSAASFSTWVRQLLQNWRQGTVGCKTRAEVNRTGKKPWKQKGTGRARAGTARSPLWRGGGIVFGPQPRTRTLKVTKKVKEGVLNTLLWNAVDAGKVVTLNWKLDAAKPKTALAQQVLKQAGLDIVKVCLLLPADDFLHFASFGNIPNVRVVPFDAVNAYDLALADKWVVLEKDLDVFKDMVSAWH
ncbi:MAG: 50S ribosomal protein L4 [Candidatus Babeliales bacterium]